jgi:hypothetical protein
MFYYLYENIVQLLSSVLFPGNSWLLLVLNDASPSTAPPGALPAHPSQPRRSVWCGEELHGGLI